MGERVSVKIFQMLNALGILLSMAPVSTEAVARKMAHAGSMPYEGERILKRQETGECSER